MMQGLTSTPSLWEAITSINIFHLTSFLCCEMKKGHRLREIPLSPLFTLTIKQVDIQHHFDTPGA